MSYKDIRYLWVSMLCSVVLGWSAGSALAQPANDNFEDAQEITGAGGSVSGNNEGATEQVPDEPIHFNLGGVSVWFRWVAPSSGTVYFHTMGSSFDTLLAAYTGTALDNLVQIAANDDVYFYYYSYDYGLTSYISFEAEAGVEYFIAVDGFFGDTGDYVLTWGLPGEAGIFNFTSPIYTVTEDEIYGYVGVDNDRDLPGAMVTVNRIGGSLGRTYVDFFVTNTVLTIYSQTNIVTTNSMGNVETNTIVITNLVNSAEPFEDYYPTNGTLVFDHLQTSTNMLLRIGYGYSFGYRTNRPVFALVYLTNARADTNENPSLVAPVIGVTNVARLEILQILDFPARFSLDRAYYRVDERDSTVWVSIVLPGTGPGSVILETVDRANLWSAYYRNLADGSDYADDRDAVFPNPPYTDGSPPLTNYADFVTFSRRISFGDNTVAVTTALPIIRNDDDPEFNEDIMIVLRDPQGDKGIYHGFANITILYDDEPAGAADREWNPDNVSFTVPPFNLKPGANNEVFAVGIQGDQKALIGGDFTAYNTVPRSRVARLNVDGSLDTTFNPGTGADGFVSAVLPYPAVFSNNVGRVLLGGAFSSVNNLQRNGIARLLANGSLDPSFAPGTGFDGVVRGLSLMDDGKIVAVGDFSFFNGIARRGVARLNNDGSLDNSFDSGGGANGIVWAVGVDNQFQSFPISATLAGVGRAEFRTNINAQANAGVLSIVFSPECVPDRLTAYFGAQQIFDSGLTNEYRNDLNCNALNYTGPISYFVPFGPGGSTDITLVVNEGGGDTNEAWRVDAQVETFTPGQKVYIGGEFTTINGVSRKGIARLNSDGSLDTTFDPGDGADGPVFSLAIQPDKKVVFGGRFETVDFRPRRSVARMNADGSLDLSYNPGEGANNNVFSIVLQKDSKAVIAGQFTSFDGVRRLGLARLFTNGILDTSFMDTAYNHFAGLPNHYSFEPPNFINAIAMQANGDFIAGGSFETVGGNASSEIVRNAFHMPVYTRQDRRTRLNVARFLGGYTPGPGNAALAYSEYTADENGEALAITLRRFDGRLGTLQAVMQTTNRVAQEGTDYLAITNTPTWPEYAYVAPRSVGAVGPSYAYLPLVDDDLIEGDEALDAIISQPSASITLGGGYYYYSYYYDLYFDYYYYGYYSSYRGGEFIPLGGARGRFEAPITIVDNDFKPGILTFSQPVFSVTENGLEATITVIRTNGAVGVVSVEYVTLNGTAVAGEDYLSSQGTLTFSSGTTNRSFKITILDDLAAEFDETVLLVLTNAAGGALLPGGLATSSENAILNIVDNDFAPGRLNFAVENFHVSEGAGYADIVVTRTGGSIAQVNVTLSTMPGSALDGSDYIGTNVILSWNNGVITPRSVRIPIINEIPAQVEGPETFTVVLSDPSIPGLIGQTGAATVTIEDDDAFGQLAFSQPVFEADENGGTTAITVVRFGGTAGTVRVDYLVTDGPAGMENAAVEGEDFLPAAGTLEFQPGETAHSFPVTILDDTEKDGDKVVSLFLRNPVNASLADPTNAFLNVVDNESFNIPAGSLDTTFSALAGTDGDVFDLALQPDGKVIVAGDFGRLNNITKTRVGRVHANGSIDGLFSVGPGPNASVRTLALQPDGKVLLGGFFTKVHGTNRNYIARLNRDGTVDTSFNPGSGADSPVFALELLEDGRVIVGGSFATYNGISRSGIAVVHPNGSLDQSFHPEAGTDQSVLAVAHQRDGKILIAGAFTFLGTTPRNRVARLNPDGSIDPTFDPGIGPDASVRTLLVQPDGRILIGGAFEYVNGVRRDHLALLQPDGTLDPDFLEGLPGANDVVLDVALQLDGKILVVGEFSRFNNVTRNRITRLLPDGRTDPMINFGAGANGFIASVLVQPDRRILIGGGFTEYNLLPRNRVARLHGGAIAGSGAVEFSAPVFTAYENVQEAVILVRRIGGTTGDVSVNFTDIPGSATPGEDYAATNGVLSFLEGEVQQSFRVVILDDSLVEPDESVLFLLSTNGSGGVSLGPQPVTSLNIISDDSIVGFQSATFKISENVPSGFATITVERTGAINGTVSVDYTTRNGTALNGSDYVQTNGTLVFTNGQSLQIFRVQILDNDLAEPNETVQLVLSNLLGSAVFGQGSATLTILDDDFGPGELAFSTSDYYVGESSSDVTLTIVRTNGAVGTLSMGYYTTGGTATPGVDFVSSQGLVEFRDGQTEQSFHIPILGDTLTEGNESFFVTVSNLQGGAIFSGPATVMVTILDDEFPLGTLDQCFDPGDGANALVRTLALQSDGKILLGGAFTLFDNVTRNFIARLNRDGTHDLTFDPGLGANGLVASVAVQSDDKVLLGGAFTSVGGMSFQRLARLGPDGAPDLNYNQVAFFNGSVNTLAIQFDNRLVVGGQFNLPTRSISQLRLNGTVDASFDPGLGVNGPVHVVLTQPNGGVFLGGAFTEVGGLPRHRVARLTPSGSVDTGFQPPAMTNGSVFCLALQTNGQLVIAGDFRLAQTSNRVGLARLNLDGSLDEVFHPGAGVNAAVYGLDLQSQGKIMIGGSFTKIGDVARNRYARLNQDGSVDLDFQIGSGANNTIYSLLVLPDDNIVIGGDFTVVNGVPRQRVARVLGAQQTEFTIVDLAFWQGQTRISVTTQPGKAYVLEASQNLIDWTPVQTNNASCTALDMTDTEAAGFTSRFYRVRTLGL